MHSDWIENTEAEDEEIMEGRRPIKIHRLQRVIINSLLIQLPPALVTLANKYAKI